MVVSLGGPGESRPARVPPEVGWALRPACTSPGVNAIPHQSSANARRSAGQTGQNRGCTTGMSCNGAAGPLGAVLGKVGIAAQMQVTEGEGGEI